MYDSALTIKAEEILERCRGRDLTLATAESCTGGLIAGLFTDIPGSSDVVDCGFVTYSNRAKQAMLGVPEATLRAHGAVSEPVARAMAEGVLANSPVDIALAVTGIAGPGGGTDAKPVGLVYLAAGRRGAPIAVEHHVFDGDRHAVRMATVARALDLAFSLSQAARPA